MKKKRNKGKFSKRVVIFCIAEMAFMQIWAMWIADKDLYSTAELLTANHAVFGGELLLLCLKRLFAKGEKENGNSKDDTKKIVES